MRVTIAPRAREESPRDPAVHRTANREAADRTIRSIRDRIKLLGRHPKLGQPRESIAPDVRNFPVGRYVIFYRIEADSVVVLRVLHGARDAEAQF